METDLDHVDIVKVARELGIQVSRPKRAGQTLALCPFHKESTPSFVLYHQRGTIKPHYHCFGCLAHGGVLDLITEKGAAQDYAGAFSWLRDHDFLEADPSSAKRRSRVPTEDAAVKAFLEAAKKDADPALLETFAQSRHFDLKILSAAGVLAVDLGPSTQRLDPNKDETRLLIKLGLVRQADIPILSPDFGSTSLAAFVNGPRIIIPLRDINGTYVSALARASRYDQEPKYKFPAKFERGNHLFGLQDVVAELRAANGKQRSLFFDLYLVEGVFDALRLRSIGRQAAACFGASITRSQITLIEQVAEIAAGNERTLRVHLFFDADRAGRDGTARALARLMGSAAEKGYLIDVVRPPGAAETTKEDPDSWILKQQAAGTEVDLDAITHPALHTLVANYLDDSVGIEDVEGYWEKLTWPEKFSLQQRLNRRLKEIDYNSVRNVIRPDLTSLAATTAKADVPPALLSQDLQRMAIQRAEPVKTGQQLPLFTTKKVPLSTRLHDAIELAFEASSSREYPVDVGSWERLRKTAMIFVPLLEARINDADWPIRPFTAHYVARSNGKPRLKCGPCPEDAILQQHFLIELLKLDNDRFQLEKVPAVRWWPNRREIETTGRGGESNETVSFGYQIDMSALDGRPDRRGGRRDIFRPFIECWNGYIASIGRRLERMPSSIVHVARLDIRRFYDEIPRWLIHQKLDDILGAVLNLDPKFSERLGFSKTGHDEQRDRIRDWVLAHSFGGDEDTGYSFIDPMDGQVRSWGRPGRGLPQGPPLSAYLATISLFDMDKRMVEEVAHIDKRVRQAENLTATNKKRSGAVYARYVDDIIIIASSEMDLRHLLNCVGDEVSKAGLRLNEKSEVLLPKTIAEAREWLVERRGNGASYDSGGLSQQMPAPVHEIPTSWSDIPGLDRRHLLATLHDPILDDPALTWDAAWNRLRDAAKAGSDLRESDHVFFARRLLMRVILRHDLTAVNANTNLAPLAEDIAEHWRILGENWQQPFQPDQDDGGADQAAHEALHNSAALLALFDGVERMLVGRPELNPSFSPESQDKLQQARRAFVQAIRHGLLNHLCNVILKSAGLVLKAQLAQYQIILEERADISWRQAESRTKSETDQCISRRHSPLDRFDLKKEVDHRSFWRLQTSWHRSFCGQINNGSFPAIERSLRTLRETLECHEEPWKREAPFAALHSGLCLLEAFTLLSANSDIVAQDNEARSVVEKVLASASTFGSDGAHVKMTTLLRTWFVKTDSAGHTNDQMVVNAAFAFCLLLKGSGAFSSLLQKRRPILQTLSESANAELLPPPPLADEHHLLFRDGNQLIDVQLINGETRGDFPVDIDWGPQKETTIEEGFKLIRRAATIPDGFAFLPHGLGETPAFNLAHVADLVEALMKRVGQEHRDNPDTALAITPYSILYRVTEDAPQQKVSIKLVAWRVEAKEVQGLAFRRSGTVLLTQRTPHTIGDWLWRAGTAVADVLSAASYAADTTDMSAEEATLSPDHERLQAVLRRKLFSRIQGYHLPPNINSVDLENGDLPRYIGRILEALHTAAREGGEQALPAIVQHFIEGRVMRLRSRTPVALESVSTGVAGMLAQIGRETLCVHDEFFRSTNAPAGGTFGRSTEAYRRVAHVLDSLAGSAHLPEVSDRLRIASVGVRLWAMTIAWREFALALLARLDTPVRQSLIEMQPELAKWELEGSVFLVKPALGWSEADASDFWMQLQVSELSTTLAKAFADSRAVDVHTALDRITLLGWVVVAGMATASLPFVAPKGRDRTALALTQTPATEEMTKKLAELAVVLASGPSPEQNDQSIDWPWDLFSHLAKHAPDVKAEATLVAAAAAADIEWVSPAPEGKALSDLDALDGRFSYSPKASETVFRPSHWRLVYTTVPGETKSRPETCIVEREEERQVWTTIQTISTKEALVISVASNALIRQSGVHPPSIASFATDNNLPDAKIIEVDLDVVEQPLPPAEPNATSFDEEDRTAADNAPPLPPTPPPSLSDDTPPPNDPGKAESSDKEKISAEEINAILKEWRENQKKEWQKRNDVSNSHWDRSYFRFAFLQTDFAEGYEDPKMPTGHLEIGESKHYPDNLCWPQSSDPTAGKRKLCLDEWRRRKVIIQVIETCMTFGVEVLLLPEYSMRAETVLWLAGYLEEKGANLSVWAGTFRVPSKFQVHVDQKTMRGTFVAQGAPNEPGAKVWNSLDAVLPVIFRDRKANEGPIDGKQDGAEIEALLKHLPNALHSRRKNFPALAYEEIFRPPNRDENLHPIMVYSRSIARAESFVTELICSEIFAFNGPTNIDKIAANLVSLDRKFGKTKSKLEDYRKLVNEYNCSFSDYVSHGNQRRHRPRRTIIMLPCITKRAKDYHAFGTTLHLSASSNIIFCNSSLEGLGSGESCVIGFRSWDEKQNKSKMGPYHGVLPGLYIPSDGDGIKPLGPKERALVIVDLEPFNPALPNPRPQYVTEPVRLIAHIPIMEYTRENVKPWQVHLANMDDIYNLTKEMLSLTKHHLTSTMHLAMPRHKDILNNTLALLKRLSTLYPESPSLKKRMEYFKEAHGGMPEAWPPPVLIDWLGVDLDITGFKDCIDKLGSNDLDRSVDGPGFPLIWVEPPSWE